MKRRKMSIKWRVFIYLIGFTAFLLFLLWYFQIAHLNSFYQGIKKRELRTAAESLLENLNTGDIEDYIRDLADQYDLGINLTDSEGNSISSANIMENSNIFIYNSEQYEYFYGKAEKSGGTAMFEVNGRYN